MSTLKLELNKPTNPNHGLAFLDRQIAFPGFRHRSWSNYLGSGWLGKCSTKASVGLCLGVSLLAGEIQRVGASDEPAVSPAEMESMPWEKGFLRFGGFITAFNSNLGFGINGGPSVEIAAEDGLGLDSSLTVLRLDAAYRPGRSRRNQLDFTYAAYHRKGRRTLSADLDLGDQTIPAGAEVGTVFNFDIIRGTYTYAFLQDDRMRIAGGLGVYAVPLKYGLEVLSGGGSSEINGADTTIPLPAVALRAEFLLTRKLFLVMDANFMYLEISGFQGSLMDNTFGLEYRPWKHVGFGAAYSGMAVHVEQDKADSKYLGADFIGSVDVKFNGLMLYGKLSF